MKCIWCLQCHSFQVGDNTKHRGHPLVTLGEDQTDSIIALDDIIQYGQDTISELNGDLDNARRVRSEIAATKEKFTATLQTRIERIAKDVREALEEQAMALMADVEKKVSGMEVNAKEALQKTSNKLDTANSFLKKAAVTLPDDDGKFDEQQFREIFILYNALDKMKSQPQPEVTPVAVSIKFPNTMKIKTQCRELSKSIIGEIENTKRPSLLDAKRPSIDVANINDFNKN